jgi:DNA-directed RNA polymerase specialized sigma24 family protein
MTLGAVNFGQLFDERDRRLRGSAAGPLGVTQLWRLKRRNRPERDVLIAALRSLPRRQREVLVLRYYADLDVGEVSQILRIGPNDL